MWCSDLVSIQHQTSTRLSRLPIIKYRRRNEIATYGYWKSEFQFLTIGSQAWRSLGRLHYYLIQGPSQVLVDGRLHWFHWCTWLRGSCRLLVSLDIEDEQLRAIPRPEGEGLFRCNFDMVNLRGCFVVGVPCNNGTYDIWVTKDYEVKEPWIKEYNIDIQVPQGLKIDVIGSFRDSKVVE